MKLTKKEISLVLLAVFLVALLVVLPAAAGKGNEKGKQENKADGVWCYMPDLSKARPILFYNTYPEDPTHPPDPNELITNYGQPAKSLAQAPYTAEWTGVFTGQSTEYGVLIIHDPEPMVFLDSILFDEVEVKGKIGSLYMDAFGNREEVGAGWKGTWIISGGTGELENLEGHGTFWGPGWQGDPEECGVIYYKVKKLKFNDGD